MPAFIRNLFSYSFRVFFVAGTLYGFLVMLLWSLGLLGLGPIANHPDSYQWHAHEMVFGFVYAIVAGFALTAVATWTGRPPVQGSALALLLLAWLVGRVATMFTGVWPLLWVAVLDLLFPALLVYLFGREVLAAGNRRNLPLVGIVMLLGIMNLLFYFGSGLTPGMSQLAILLGVHVLLLLIAVVAGRIIPSFTANWLRAQGCRDSDLPKNKLAVDLTALVLTVATGLAVTFAPVHPLSGMLAFAAAAAHALRLSGWAGLRTGKEPLLLVMHLAYAWFPVGYVLVGIAVFGNYLAPTALHALTIGVITGMVLAMTTRVPLGHTGRPLRAARITVVVYVLWMVTVCVRLSGPFFGIGYVYTVETAATLWLIFFILYAWVYWPMLSGPRADAHA